MSAAKEKGIVVRLDIPADHHPAVITGDSPGANLGREALSGLYDAYGKINDTAARVQDKARLAAAVQPFAESAVQRATCRVRGGGPRRKDAQGHSRRVTGAPKYTKSCTDRV